VTATKLTTFEPLYSCNNNIIRKAADACWWEHG